MQPSLSRHFHGENSKTQFNMPLIEIVIPKTEAYVRLSVGSSHTKESPKGILFVAIAKSVKEAKGHP